MDQITKWKHYINETERQHFHDLPKEQKEEALFDKLLFDLNNIGERTKGFYVRHISTGRPLTKSYKAKGTAMSALTKISKWSRYYFTINTGYPNYKQTPLCEEYKDSDLSKMLIEKGIVEIAEMT